MVVFTWGALVQRSLLAAQQAERDGISVAVVDLRTIIPYDWETIAAYHAEDKPRRRRARGSAHLRLRRRDCRAHLAGTVRTPRRAGDARCRARLSGGLCARSRGANPAEYFRRPRGDSHARRVLNSEMGRVLAVILTSALPEYHDRRQAVGRGPFVNWRSPASRRRTFEEPLGFQQTPGGPYYVFDRRGHTVYAVDSDKKARNQARRDRARSSAASFSRAASTPHQQDPSSSRMRPAASSAYRFSAAAGSGAAASRCPARQRTAAIAIGPLVVNGIASIQFTEPTLADQPP